MHTEQLTVKTTDNVDLHVYKWQPDDEPWAVLQIAHGMVEHAERYTRFAEALTKVGIVVYANDHRGHGKTAKTEEERGHFADTDGWDVVTDDMKQLTDRIHHDFPDLPIILFGHSIGSMLSRWYVQKYGAGLSGLILSATAGDPGILGTIGLKIVEREIRKRGTRGKSELMNKLIFGSYNKAFKPTRTDFDWLSRDMKEVDKYIQDPDCGFIVSATFYRDMIKGIKDLEKPTNLAKVPKDLPIFLLAGDKDPVGQNTKGVMRVYNKYKKVGIQDVTYKFYEGARHEILNETNRDEVTGDIIQWVKQKV